METRGWDQKVCLPTNWPMDFHTQRVTFATGQHCGTPPKERKSAVAPIKKQRRAPVLLDHNHNALPVFSKQDLSRCPYKTKTQLIDQWARGQPDGGQLQKLLQEKWETFKNSEMKSKEKTELVWAYVEEARGKIEAQNKTKKETQEEEVGEAEAEEQEEHDALMSLEDEGTDMTEDSLWKEQQRFKTMQAELTASGHIKKKRAPAKKATGKKTPSKRAPSKRAKATEKAKASENKGQGELDDSIKRFHPEWRFFYNSLVPSVKHIGQTSYRVLKLAPAKTLERPEMVQPLNTPANVPLRELMRCILIRSIRETDMRKKELLANNRNLRPTSLSGTLPIKSNDKPTDKLVGVHCIVNIHQHPYICMRFESPVCTYVSLWFLGDVIRWKIVPLHHSVWATNPIPSYDQINWSDFEQPFLTDPDLDPDLLEGAIY